jgi:predicted DNA-binding transcriptional regulator AlpA
MSKIGRTKRALRPAQVVEKLGVSVPTVWRYARENPTFPRPSKLSPRVTVFGKAAVDAWLDGRRGVAA